MAATMSLRAEVEAAADHALATGTAVLAAGLLIVPDLLVAEAHANGLLHVDVATMTLRRPDGRSCWVL